MNAPNTTYTVRFSCRRCRCNKDIELLESELLEIMGQDHSFYCIARLTGCKLFCNNSLRSSEPWPGRSP